MKQKLLITILLIITTKLYCQSFISLWPDHQMPNSKGLNIQPQEERQRITRVAEPGIHAFFPSSEENKRSTVLICPPGGYQKLTYQIAGFQFAKWLNTLGVNAFVLIHRLPTSPDLIEREKGPIQDAQRAMKLIRIHADQWQIDTNKIGIMGASAGGHLASTIGTHKEDFSIINDTIDRHTFSPNFMILISPVISMGEHTHQGSRNHLLGSSPSRKLLELYSNEMNVNRQTPPTFIVHAQNDRVVSPLNSILFYKAMIENGVQGSLHIFPEGEHSIALRNNPGSTNSWPQLCEEWLKEMKIIE